MKTKPSENMREKISNYLTNTIGHVLGDDFRSYMSDELLKLFIEVCEGVIGEEQEVENPHVVDWLDSRRQDDNFIIIANYMRMLQRQRLHELVKD